MQTQAPSAPPTSPTPAARLDESRLAHHDVDVGGVRLHYVEAGEGPLVLLLHGFPDFWYGWRNQIPALVGAGFRVVAPDLRGYDLSDKPQGVLSYGINELTRDVAGLLRALGAERAVVVGHDWGAGVAWAFAMAYPSMVERLVTMNGPHPARLRQALATPSQLARSWYMFFFQLPFLPEAALRARRFAIVRRTLRREPLRRGAFDDRDIERHVEALSRPGALTAMVNYYRAAFRPSARPHIRPIEAPTLVIWGERDPHLGRELAAPSARLVPNARVEYLPDASHWVQHDRPDRVNELLIQFLKGAALSDIHPDGGYRGGGLGAGAALDEATGALTSGSSVCWWHSSPSGPSWQCSSWGSWGGEADGLGPAHETSEAAARARPIVERRAGLIGVDQARSRRGAFGERGLGERGVSTPRGRVKGSADDGSPSTSSSSAETSRCRSMGWRRGRSAWTS